MTDVDHGVLAEAARRLDGAGPDGIDAHQVEGEPGDLIASRPAA